MRLLSLIALTLGIILYSSCSTPAERHGSISEHVTEEQLRDCERKMHISFPPGTQTLGINELTGGLDDAIYLKVQIPSRELDALLKASPFAKEQLSSDRREIYDIKSMPWWKPDSVKNHKSGQVALPDAKYLNILLDLDSEDIVIVYLLWHET